MAAAAILFAASASVVIWQNSRLTILWDVSYILENAWRIAAGDVPYRDFPFPYAPLTFLIQAGIIRLFGRVYWHHAAWAALTCGGGSALTYAIIRRLLPRRLAIVLAAPVAVLGIYCILPHPFYDPDCCFAILAIIAAMLFGSGNSYALGMACVVPLLTKQNIGLAFVAAALLLFLVERFWRSFAGVVIGLSAAAASIAVTCGMGNYLQWTVRYAAARRLPPVTQLLSMYNDSTVWWWLAFILAGLFLRPARWLFMVPFLWSEIRFFTTDDPNEAEINFLRLWPLFLLAALAVTLMSWRRERGGMRLLPLLIFASVHGAFLSQGTWGSTYGIWPLLLIVIAAAFRVMKGPLIPGVVIAAVMLHFGGWYVWENQRLEYAKWDDGELRTSSFPQLRGLHECGEWLPDFEELVRFSAAHIPRDEAILILPGEDLFYFTTGRRPRMPVLMFDRTVNPYSPQQIAAIASRVRWVVVKKNLQLEGDPFPELARVLQSLGLRGKQPARLRNYDVYDRATDGTFQLQNR